MIKLNFFLHVIGRRADGYHVLEHLAVPYQGPDRVAVKLADTDQFEVLGHFASSVPLDNSLTRARDWLRQSLATDQPLSIKLWKETPAGAGLGAGSYNAAQFIGQALALLDQEASLVTLREKSLALGAEMPFCLQNAPKLVGGVGERLEDLPFTLPECYPLIVWPGKSLLTQQVFATFAEEPRYSKPLRRPLDPHNLLQATRNDLTHAAYQIVPEIARVLEQIKAQQGCWLSRMTGSGSACFGLFQDQGLRDQALKNLKGQAWVYAP